MQKLIEIRSYQLQPGSGAQFHHLVSTQSLPLMQAAKMEVVAFGQSVHDADAYFLIRAYRDLAHLETSQNAFYASDAWRKGPREEIIALIVADSNVMLWMTEDAVLALKNGTGRG